MLIWLIFIGQNHIGLIGMHCKAYTYPEVHNQRKSTKFIKYNGAEARISCETFSPQVTGIHLLFSSIKVCTGKLTQRPPSSLPRGEKHGAELNPKIQLHCSLRVTPFLNSTSGWDSPPSIMALKFNSTRNSRTDQMPITNAVRYSGSLGRCRPLQWGQNDFICAYNYNRLCRKNRSIIRACSALCKQTVDIIY